MAYLEEQSDNGPSVWYYWPYMTEYSKTEVPAVNTVEALSDIPDRLLSIGKIVAIGVMAAGTVALAALDISAHKKMAKLKKKWQGDQYWPTR
jgi:PIN domain nuclease of toxin-antitoxin system